MESTQIVYPKDLDFEQVWAMFQETDRRMKETDRQMKETDRKFQETDRQMKETDRKFQDTERLMKEIAQRFKETEKLIKSNGEQIGGLHRSIGELAEHLVAPGIAARFNELGFHFDTIAPGGLKIQNEKGDKVLTEIDLLLENGENIIVIEVKARVTVKDIEHHKKRLDILKENRERKQEKPNPAFPIQMRYRFFLRKPH